MPRNSPTRKRSSSTPRSSSWLPKVTRSTGTAFKHATIERPLSRLDSMEGAKKSPAKVVSKVSVGCSFRRRATKLARRGIWSKTYTSLTQTKRKTVVATEAVSMTSVRPFAFVTVKLLVEIAARDRRRPLR